MFGDTALVDADGPSAHVLVMGEVAKILAIPAESMDTIGGAEARVTRTVLRSEVLRILAGGPLDMMITASGASFLGSDEFLAAFAARVLPVSLLVLTRNVDEAVLQRLRSAGAQVEHIAPPVTLELLRERVSHGLRQRRLTSRNDRTALPELARRIERERGSFTLHVSAGAEYGSLTFVDGVLVDAQNARRTGDRAALDILGWRQTSVVFDRIVPVAPVTVHQGLSALIADAGRGPAARPVLSDSEEILPPPTIPLRAAGPENRMNRPSRRSNEEDMANINKTLEETMKIDGAIGAAIADWDSGLCLGMAGGGSRLNIEVAAAGNCQVVKAKMSTMNELGIKGAIQDILITLDDQIHLLRPLKNADNMFMYLAIDKTKGNLAMARHRMSKLESELSV